MGLFGNKFLQQTAMNEAKKFFKKEGIHAILVFLDDKGEVQFEQYKEPVKVIPVKDIEAMINNIK